METKAKKYLIAELLFVLVVLASLFLVGCNANTAPELSNETDEVTEEEMNNDESISSEARVDGDEEDNMMEDENEVEEGDEMDEQQIEAVEERSEEEESNEESNREAGEDLGDDTDEDEGSEEGNEEIADPEVDESGEVSVNESEVAAQPESDDSGQEETKLYRTGLQDYEAEAFAQAIADGKTVLADVHADWCPLCIANKPKLVAALSSVNNAGGEVVLFTVNFDKHRDFLAANKVPDKTTYLLFEGSEDAPSEEVRRVAGLLTQEAFEDFIQGDA